MIEAFLFDVDGVLVEAVEIHKKAFKIACEHFNIMIEDEYHDKYLNGLPTKIKVLKLVEDFNFDITNSNDLNTIKQQKTIELFNTELKPNKEIISVLKSLSYKYRLVACSNALKKSVNIMLSKTQTLPYITAYFGNDDVVNPKPNPEIYLKAAKYLELDIKNCVIIEDSPVGLNCAINARPGMIVIVDNPKDINFNTFKPFLK
jgi:HAD superfamily hydrolase (TIGR01509 family)